MTTVVGVSDEVWRQLDPAAGRLSTRTRVRVAMWGLGAGAVVGALLTLTASGVFIHRFTVELRETDGTATSCSQTFALKNDGWFDEHIEGATVSAHGSDAELVHDPAGSRLPSGGTIPLRVHYVGAVCRSVFAAPAPTTRELPDLTITLDRPWGTSISTVRLAPQPDVEGVSFRW